MHRLKVLSKEFLLKATSPFVSFPIENNKLIFSDPRGGSTWLAELIHESPKTALVWEPLALQKNSVFKKLDFDYRQHIPADAIWPEAKKQFDLIFSGKSLDFHTSRRNTFADYLRAKQLIIKVCRGSALLPWIVSNYDFKYQPVYMLRHPFAVAASQMQQGGWDYEFTKFEIASSPFNEIYKEHEEFLNSLTLKEEALVATWCISNKVSIDSINRDKYTTIFYEELLLKPAKILDKIYSSWGEEVPDSIYKKINIPSATTATKLKSRHEQLKKWQSYFTFNQILSLKKVLEYFNISAYDDHHLPSHMR